MSDILLHDRDADGVAAASTIATEVSTAPGYVALGAPPRGAQRVCARIRTREGGPAHSPALASANAAPIARRGEADDAGADATTRRRRGAPALVGQCHRGFVDRAALARPR